MKRITLAVFILCSVLSAEERPITNDDVLKMVRAGLPESTIVLAIHKNPARFDTDAAVLNRLKVQGVSDGILGEMMAAPVSTVGQKDYTRNAGGGMNFFSLDDDRSLGQRYANELNQRLALIGDPAASGRLGNLGRRLVAASSNPRQNCTFFAVNTREVNAYALPGCFVYVNRDLIDLAENEDQLAGVVAHEIGHALARHSTKQMSKQLLLAGVVAGATAAVGQKSQTWANIVATAGGAATMLANLKYSRDDERQADALAAVNMAAAGYDPRQLIAFFERMDASASSRGKRLMALLQTHPPAADRRQALAAQIPGLAIAAGPPRQEFAALRAGIAGLPLPPERADVTLSNALVALGASENSLPPLGARQQAQVSITLPGNTAWIDTGVNVTAGQSVQFWAAGEIFVRKGDDLPSDPNGLFGSGSAFFRPISSLNTGALIGRVNAAETGKPFAIGAGRTLRLEQSGNLQIGINDDNVTDNRGNFQVWILTR